MFINLGKQETGKINHLRTFFLGKCLTHLDNFRCCSTHACTIAQMRDIGKTGNLPPQMWLTPAPPKSLQSSV